MTGKVGYLGPPGTFTETALLAMPTAAGCEPMPLPSVEAVLASVRLGSVEAGVVPIENSLEGPVTTTLDSLANGEEPLHIIEEWALPVRFALLAAPGTTLAEIQRISTIPIAAAQCQKWLNKKLPGVQLLAAVSTTEAAAELGSLAALKTGGATRTGARADAAPADNRLQGLPYQAAISPARAADHYGLEVLATDIGDNPDATTRFVMVRRAGSPPPPTGADKTTLVLYMREDHSGALLEILTEFAVRGVNLTRIESRPTRKQLGDYYFSVDCEGHVADARVGEALTGLRRVCADVQYLGSYPRHDGKQPHVRSGTADSDFTAAAQWLTRIRSGTG